ncbi:MAG: hypothetical protein JO209_03970 [Acidisphaera sp.]|nr:hypothetical protein [Acidisphaera sp.]
MAEDRPTTENGPLHDPAVDMDDRRIVAMFDNPERARAARASLLQSGIPESALNLMEHAAADVNAAASARPTDDSVLGKVRAAVLPDDDTLTYSEAVRRGHAMLTVHPAPEQVETVVRVLEASKPLHFDARLERWRNAG